MSGSAATIPMDVMGGGGPSSPPASPGGLNLGMFDQILGLQQKLNTQKMFQAQFGARQKAGQIISSAPDLETGLAQAAQDPSVAAFGGEVLNSYRQMQQTLTATQGMQQEQNAHGLQAIVKAAAASINNPSQDNLAKNFNTALASMPPEIRARDKEAATSLWHSLTDGVTSGDDLRKNLIGQFGAAGGTPEALQTMVGARPVSENLGNRMVFGNQSLFTGGMTPQTSLGTGLAPQVTEVPTATGGIQKVIVGGGGASGGSPSDGRGMPSAQGNALVGGAQNAPASAPSGGNSLGGTPIGPPSLGKADTEYQSGVGKDMADYRKNLNENVTAGNNIMASISQARDAMQQFRPGAGAETYTQLGKLVQAFGGSQQLVDKVSNGNLAASQEMQKQMVGTAMGQVKQQMDGQGRITQAEFQEFRKNNPNIDTDPRAIEKIFNFWTQTHNRNVEEQKQLSSFKGNIGDWPAVWQDRQQQLGYTNPVQTQGGAALAATQPQGQAQAQGTKPGAYAKPEDVISAYKSGKLDRDAAKRLLQSNGWAQ